jgi:thiol-disulfide isomerase/thioredoxin
MKELILLFFVTISLASFGQKQKVVYLDTLGNKIDFMSTVSIMNTGRYKWDIDESDPKTRYFKWRKTTDTEFDSLLQKYETRSILLDKIGQPFNVGEIVDIKGKRYTQSELTGKVLVINYWFVGCGPCEIEMPELNKLVDKYKDNDEIVFVSFAKSSKLKVERFLERRKFSYPVISMTGEQIKKFKIMYYPTNYVVDKKGVLHFASQGAGPGGVHLLGKGIEATLNK